jgi:tagatose 6-phosphate kinase
VIVTVTANVAIDRTYEIDHLEVGAVHKVNKVFSHIGGKGVNVSRTLDALRAKTLITGLIGDATLDEATRELANASLKSALFPVSRATRQTVTVTTKDGTATAFDEAGPQITRAEWSGFELHFGALLRDASMVVIAGSLPPGTPNESLANLCQKANSHRVPVILDARGAAMRAAQNQAPLVAKLNRGELEQTLGRELTTEDDILEGAQELHAQGAQNVVITLGSDGAIGLNEHGVWRVTHPTASGNPIGAGDAFSAALAIALLDKEPLEEALTKGAAAALASLKAPTAGALNPDDMQRALPNIHTQQITKETAPR